MPLQVTWVAKLTAGEEGDIDGGNRGNGCQNGPKQLHISNDESNQGTPTQQHGGHGDGAANASGRAAPFVPPRSQTGTQTGRGGRSVGSNPTMCNEALAAEQLEVHQSDSINTSASHATALAVCF